MSKLKSQIDSLSKNEYIEIFKIIKMNGEKFSQNKNGIMFDLMKFSDKTIDEINNFINYIENNNILVEHDEETRNVFRTLIN
uniref:NET domain-containing protein n=1 Tax=viral metagenome TaxID=1070528 RepID=A0A6C0EI55_9ZZZZ